MVGRMGFPQIGWLGIGLALVISLSACETQFEPQLTPLVIPTVGPQPFQGDIETSGTQLPTVPAGTVTPAAGFGEFTSSQAIELCQEIEYFGDERIGSCLAPGGETYFVWVSEDQVMEVSRDNDFLASFRTAAGLREGALNERSQRAFSLAWKGPMLLVTTLGLSLCGMGAVPGPQQGPLLLACGIDVAGWLYSASQVPTDASAWVNSHIQVNQRAADAEYNFCRMEGNSDAACR